jgi:hypothetical protein
MFIRLLQTCTPRALADKGDRTRKGLERSPQATTLRQTTQIDRRDQRARTAAVACRTISIEVPPSAQPMSVKVKGVGVSVSGTANGVEHEPRRAVDHVFVALGGGRKATAVPHGNVNERRCSLCHVHTLRWRNSSLRKISLANSLGAQTG